MKTNSAAVIFLMKYRLTDADREALKRSAADVQGKKSASQRRITAMFRKYRTLA